MEIAVFSCFPFLLPRPDANFSLQQLSFLFSFFLRWIFDCFPFLLPRPDAKFSLQQLSFLSFFPTMDFRLFQVQSSAAFLPLVFLDGFWVVFPFCSPGLMRSSVLSSFPPPFFFLDGFSVVFPFCSPGPMRISVFSSFPFYFLFSYDGFSVVFPFCSPGLMRSSVFSSFPFCLFFLPWIFGCFKFSLQQLSSPFFFLDGFWVVFPFAPPA